MKPELAIHWWGPIIHDIEEDDKTSKYSDSKFSDLMHIDKKDCPAYYDELKEIYTEPIIEEGKVYYPCDVGGCLSLCKC